MEEILRKLEILKKQMQDNAAKHEAKPDSTENQKSEKLNGVVFDKTDKDNALKGTFFKHK